MSEPIQNKSQHSNAIRRIEVLMTAQRNTAEGEELEALVTSVDAYQSKHYPIDGPTKILH